MDDFVGALLRGRESVEQFAHMLPKVKEVLLGKDAEPLFQWLSEQSIDVVAPSVEITYPNSRRFQSFHARHVIASRRGHFVVYTFMEEATHSWQVTYTLVFRSLQDELRRRTSAIERLTRNADSG
jgi:hypothetical protein